MLNIVLVEPEIPQNAGNILRTAMATNSKVYFVKPLGFSLDDKHFKRAGMDYWFHLDIRYYENIDEFFEKNKDANFYLFTKKAKHSYADISYPDDVYLFFGRESCGLPESLLEKYEERTLRIPMREGLRSLNQSNSVAIATYEYLRQKNFKGLEIEHN